MQNMRTVLTLGSVLVVLMCLSVPAAAEIGLGIKGGMLIPDQDPFKKEFDSNYILGGVLELDSNMGLVLEANVEYFSQDGASGGKSHISMYPIMFSAKYNLFPRYRTTPFVGIGGGAYFFDQDYKNGTSKTKMKFGARISGGIRLLEDRQINLVLEGARNLVDFNDLNASSYEVTLSLIFDLYPNIVGIVP